MNGRLKASTVLLFFTNTIVFNAAYALVDPYSYLNYFENTLTAIHSATQIKNQLSQLRNQTQNTQNISDYQWNNEQQLIQRLDNNMQQGQGMSYSMSNVNQRFQQRYPNYTRSPMGQTNYNQAYQNWNSTTLDTLRNTLSTAGMSANNFSNEHQLLQNLVQQGQGAQGRMQVLQVSTEIAAENVNQMEELRRLETSQVDSQNTYMAYQVSKDSYNESSLSSLESNLDTQFPQYHNNQALSVIPPMP